MTKLIDYHTQKAKYYLDTLEVVLNAEVDKYNRETLLSMLLSNKRKYELHMEFLKELENYERISAVSISTGKS